MINNNENSDYELEVQEAVAGMHPELLVENIRGQINSGLESSYNVNYLKEYINQFKYLKNLYSEDSDIVSTLKDNLEVTLRMVIDEISDKFNFSIYIDEDTKLKPLAKALYNFFVMKYESFLVEFIVGYIKVNSKTILDILKDQDRIKKGKNVTTITNKTLYGPKSPIMNNVNYIVTEIIPSMDLDREFLDYIDRDSITTNNIKELFENDFQVECDDLFESFFRPITDREIGFGSIISEVTVELANIYINNKKYSEISNLIEGEE